MDIQVEEVKAELGNKGILLRIHEPNGPAVGRLRIGKAKLEWAAGKSSKNFKTVPMKAFLAWLDEQ